MEEAVEMLCGENIHVLRGVARLCGVRCPTALRKNELIMKIIGILSGQNEPAEKDPRGRPLLMPDGSVTVYREIIEKTSLLLRGHPPMEKADGKTEKPSAAKKKTETPYDLFVRLILSESAGQSELEIVQKFVKTLSKHLK